MSDMAMKVLGTHGKSFRFSGAFLDKQQLEQAARLYAFCRWIDDLADETKDRQAAQEQLLRIQYCLREGIASCHQLNDFLSLKTQLNLATALPINLIDGVLSDLDPVAITTQDALIRYAYRVAGVVGLMMCPILQTDTRGHSHAIDLGIAMQLTNIARDVMQDANLGRRYLPYTWCQCSAQDILGNDAKTRQEVKNAIKQILNLAEQYYASAAIGLGYLPSKSRRAITLAATLYRHIGVKIQNNEWVYWRGRAVVPTSQKVLITLRALVFGHPLPKQQGSQKHNVRLHDPLRDLLPTEL